MIVADTNAVLALVDRRVDEHPDLRALYDENPRAWVLPWVILPEADYMIASRVGPHVEEAFLADVAAGRYRVEWGKPEDLVRAHELNRRYRALEIGLVDGAVIAVAERLGAEAIATFDLRHFGAVEIRGRPKLYPRDLEPKPRKKKR